MSAPQSPGLQPIPDVRDLDDAELQLLWDRMLSVVKELEEKGQLRARDYLWEHGVCALYVERLRRQDFWRDVELDELGGHMGFTPTQDMKWDPWEVWCACGWKTEGPSEEAVQEALDGHVEAFWQTVPAGATVRGAMCPEWPDLSADDDCRYAMDRTCGSCGKVRYVGPDCPHVVVHVSADLLCHDCATP